MFEKWRNLVLRDQAPSVPAHKALEDEKARAARAAQEAQEREAQAAREALAAQQAQEARERAEKAREAEKTLGELGERLRVAEEKLAALDERLGKSERASIGYRAALTILSSALKRESPETWERIQKFVNRTLGAYTEEMRADTAFCAGIQALVDVALGDEQSMV